MAFSLSQRSFDLSLRDLSSFANLSCFLLTCERVPGRWYGTERVCLLRVASPPTEGKAMNVGFLTAFAAALRGLDLDLEDPELDEEPNDEGALELEDDLLALRTFATNSFRVFILFPFPTLWFAYIF
jgi:hypothetical protein